MARTIRGKITNLRGSVQGLKVEAWEEGWAIGQDESGAAITNENGEFVIRREKKTLGKVAEKIHAWQQEMDAWPVPRKAPLTPHEDAMMQMVICLSGHSIMPLPGDFPEHHGDPKA